MLNIIHLALVTCALANDNVLAWYWKFVLVQSGFDYKVHRFLLSPSVTLASGFGVSGGAFDVKVLRIR